MPKITFIEPDGNEVVVDAEEGSIMELAIENGIEGIENACGGMCSCASCHVHIDLAQHCKLTPAEDEEKELLEYEDEVTEGSRLSCQIEISQKLDGLVVKAIA